MLVTHGETVMQRETKQSRTELKWRLESPQHLMPLLSISRHEIDELESLIATRREDFLKRSVVRHGGNSLTGAPVIDQHIVASD